MTASPTISIGPALTVSAYPPAMPTTRPAVVVSTTTARQRDSLPNTGADVAWLFVLAVLLIAVGSVMVARARKGRRT